jgi:hypothetical protein
MVQLYRRPGLGSAPDYPDTVLPVLFALFIVRADTFAAPDRDTDEMRRSVPRSWIAVRLPMIDAR